RTVSKNIAKRTAIETHRYDCCINSCMSYAMHPDLDICTECKEPRYKEPANLRNPRGNPRKRARDVPHRQARAQHVPYIPISHRIRLWWSNAAMAEKMESHVRKCKSSDLKEDYWTGDLYK
ncbi:hypothetical protein EDC01DRAFT_594950, partial [Geopyxis carbonaria]